MAQIKQILRIERLTAFSICNHEISCLGKRLLRRRAVEDPLTQGSNFRKFPIRKVNSCPSVNSWLRFTSGYITNTRICGRFLTCESWITNNKEEDEVWKNIKEENLIL